MDRTRCNSLPLATHARAMLPVFGAICGCSSATRSRCAGRWRGEGIIHSATPRMKSYEVAGIFEIGLANYDRTIIFMPFAEAQAFFNLDGVASLIEVYLDDPEKIDTLQPVSELESEIATELSPHELTRASPLVDQLRQPRSE